MTGRFAHAARRGERGSGTVVSVGAVAALVVTLCGVLVVLAAAVAAHRVRSAADLAALAGATAHAGVTSAGDPCALARQVAQANGADLRTCEVRPDGSVQVEAELALWLSRPHAPLTATARARAGPAP